MIDVVLFLKLFLSQVQNDIKANLEYRANAVSWFLADVSLYGVMFFSFLFFTQRVDNLGGYSQNDVMLYVTTFFLCNNIFAVLFSEGVSSMGGLIQYGGLDRILTMPHPPVLLVLLKGFNTPALLATFFLVPLNLYFVGDASAGRIIAYYVAVAMGSVTLALILLNASCLNFRSIRADSIAGLITLLLSVAERPDSIFPKYVRVFLTYCVPLYLLSAVPVRILTARASWLEWMWILVAPGILLVIFRWLWKKGLRVYVSSSYH